MVHETDFACRTGLRQYAVSATDHPHDFKSFRVAEAVFILWKLQVGRITRLSAL